MAMPQSAGGAARQLQEAVGQPSLRQGPEGPEEEATVEEEEGAAGAGLKPEALEDVGELMGYL